MPGHRIIMLTVLLAAAGSVGTLEGRQPSPVGEGWEARERDPCEGGIYRPFTLIRQFKLATAYFVNPALPDTAKIRYAYSLDDFGDEDLSELIQSGGAQLAVFVDNDVARALAPVHWEPASSTRDQRPVIDPCRPLSGTASDAPKMNLSWRDVDTPRAGGCLGTIPDSQASKNPFAFRRSAYQHRRRRPIRNLGPDRRRRRSQGSVVSRVACPLNAGSSRHATVTARLRPTPRAIVDPWQNARPSS